ncbi:hypothetical protein QJS04_geneDACA007186 [Acorus gramineus]|uniref:Uncharacterized protein n=1 Tax=Acorus gramineus TaxID=55184 RepID=A0AAV9BMI4_ACOGR|nr:hypothetical protein QJS04_geneDACA007186 [Acorus gramineus]
MRDLVATHEKGKNLISWERNFVANKKILRKRFATNQEMVSQPILGWIIVSRACPS